MSDYSEHLYPVIMAGGSGTRFWPLSRELSPKQILTVFDSESLLKETIKRLDKLVDRSKAYIVTSEQQLDIIKSHLGEQYKLKYVVEPTPRNTCPCIGLTALHLVRKDPEAIMLVLPSDHRIENLESFHEVIRTGIELVNEFDPLVTIGIPPTRPATGYGYIQFSEVNMDLSSNIFKVQTFAEKPTYKTAVRFLAAGDFYWNSGIFLWSAKKILSEIEEHLPDQYTQLMHIQKAFGQPDFEQKLQSHYNRIRPISIDYGIMEHSKSPIYMLLGKFKWSDVGSWDELYRIFPKDSKENVTIGDTILVNTTNSLIYSKDRLTSIVGLDNILVVNTKDATLICPLDKSEEVKSIVEKLKNDGKDTYL